MAPAAADLPANLLAGPHGVRGTRPVLGSGPHELEAVPGLVLEDSAQTSIQGYSRFASVVKRFTVPVMGRNRRGERMSSFSGRRNSTAPHLARASTPVFGPTRSACRLVRRLSNFCTVPTVVGCSIGVMVRRERVGGRHAGGTGVAPTLRPMGKRSARRANAHAS